MSEDVRALAAVVGRVCVLLATHNGLRWVDEQIDSLLGQVGVEITIVASDDGSTDGTPDRLHARADNRTLRVLDPSIERLGSANRNFLRLIRDAPLGDATHVALADQDDVWDPDKCRRACDAIARQGLDAYSSDVTAFWPDGRQKYVRKSYPQRAHDHLFESAGPGCTFVFAREVFEQLKVWVGANHANLANARVHDWLIYAHARTQGWRWSIDPHSTLHYRQHGSNDFGVNAGFNAAVRRARRALRGTYRHDVLDIAALAGATGWVVEALRRFELRDRLRLAANVRELRRRPRDQIVLAILLLTMKGGPTRPILGLR